MVQFILNNSVDVEVINAHFGLQNIDIGDLRDKDVSLVYCARLIAKQFLLTGYPSLLIPDKTVRVSVKSLALTCLGTIFQLHPHGLLRYLNKSASASTDEQCMADVLLYDNHSDPQLRGGTRILVASFLKAVLVQSGGRFTEWIQENSCVSKENGFKMDEFVKIFIKVCHVFI